MQKFGIEVPGLDGLGGPKLGCMLRQSLAGGGGDDDYQVVLVIVGRTGSGIADACIWLMVWKVVCLGWLVCFGFLHSGLVCGDG